MFRKKFLVVGSTFFALANWANDASAGQHPIRKPASENIGRSEEQRLRKHCEDQNFIWKTRRNGSRVVVGNALTDAAEYVWRDGKCELTGGLRYTPPPKPSVP